MACSTARTDGGYATPAALVLSLGFALVGAALAARGLQTLGHAKADLERTRQEIALDGAQLTAAALVIRSGDPGPFEWTFSTELGWVRALAEPEAGKVGFEAFGETDDGVLAALGVADPAALKARLAAAVGASAPVDVAALDPAALWQDCGPSLVSQSGAAAATSYAARAEPRPGLRPADWRIGETWRIRIATPAGWRDDRIVRFTGDARRPVAIVARRWARAMGDGARCGTLLREVVGG